MSVSPRSEALGAHLSLGDEAPRVIGHSPHAPRPALAGAADMPPILHARGVRGQTSGSRSGRAPRTAEALMTDHTHNRLAKQIAAGKRSLTYGALSGLSVQEADLLVNAYADYLQRRSSEERLRLYHRGRMTRCERWIWTRRYPEEVPIVNDEIEWIVLEGDD